MIHHKKVYIADQFIKIVGEIIKSLNSNNIFYIILQKIGEHASEQPKLIATFQERSKEIAQKFTVSSKQEVFNSRQILSTRKHYFI